MRPMSPVWNHRLRLAPTVASARPQYPSNMTCGRFGRTTISPSRPRSTSLSPSSKIRTSKYSSLTTPAALGLLRTPGGCHDTRLASVSPNAPLNVSTPKRSRRRLSISTGSGAAPMRRSEVLAVGAPEPGISSRSMSLASRYAIVPSVDVMVAPTRFISGQKFDTENRRSIALRPPNTSAPSTAVTSAL